MNKVVIVMIMSLFLWQIVLTPLSYAADAENTEAAIYQENKTNPDTDDNVAAMIYDIVYIDMSTASPIDVLQVAAYLYAYEKVGVLDFENEDDSLAMQSINYFLKLYAPNVWFVANEEGADEDFFAQKASIWKENYPEQYAKVYNYAQDAQIKYKNDASQWKETDNTTEKQKPIKEDQKLDSPKSNTSEPIEKKIVNSCQDLYNRWMKEYEMLIQIQDIPYRRVAYVKEQIYAAQTWEDCETITVRRATQEDIKSANQAALAQAKEIMNFGAASRLRVVPNSVQPSYCLDQTNTLRADLSTISPEVMVAMKENIDNILQSNEVQSSAIKRNLLNGFSQELTSVASEKSAGLWDSESTFNNLVEWLALTANGIANARWIDLLLSVIDANVDQFDVMWDALWEHIPDIHTLLNRWWSTYAWDDKTKTFIQTPNSGWTIDFLIPSGDAGSTNDMRIVVATAKTILVNEPNEREYRTQNKWILSLEEFVQEAKSTNHIYGYTMDSRSLWAQLSESIVSHAPDYYKQNPQQEPTPFIVEAGGEIKMFQDYNLKYLMPAWRFSDPRGTTYIVGEDGTIESIINTLELPEQIKFAVYKEKTLIAWFDMEVAYDKGAIETWRGSDFPLKMNATLYIADYLLDLSMERVKNGNTRNMDATLDIQWPTLCNLSIDIAMQYQDNKTTGLPIIEDESTNVNSITATIDYENHTIQATVNNIQSMITAINESSQNEDMAFVIDIINQYVSIDYLYNNNTLASIQADPEMMAKVVYANGQETPVMELAEKYMHLINLDMVMGFVGKYMDDGSEPYNNEQSEGNQDYQDIWENNNQEVNDNDAEDVYTQNSFYLQNYYTSWNNIYVDYMYKAYDQDDAYLVYPEVNIYIQYQSGQEETNMLYPNDQWLYIAEFASVLRDETVRNAYIYARYNDGIDDYEDVLFLIEDSMDEESKEDKQDKQEEQKTTSYAIQWERTDYEDIGISELRFILYHEDKRQSYIEPEISITKYYGTNCSDTGCETITEKNRESLSPTYLDDVPTYVIDMDEINVIEISEASVSIFYKDPSWYEHTSIIGLKG